MWGSCYTLPKAIFYLLKEDYGVWEPMSSSLGQGQGSLVCFFLVAG